MADSNLIPSMTSNTAPSGEVSVNSISSATYDGWKAVDGSETSYWMTSNTSGGWYIQYEFELEKICTSYAIGKAVNAEPQCPKDFTLQASNTGAFSGEEVTLDTQTNISWGGGLYEKQTFSFTNTTEYKYYKLNITATVYSGNSVAMGVFELIGNVEPISHLSGSATVTSKILPYPKSALTGSAVLVANGARHTEIYSFTFVGEIESSKTHKTFNMIGEIEQPKTSTVIKRVNT